MQIPVEFCALKAVLHPLYHKDNRQKSVLHSLGNNTTGHLYLVAMVRRLSIYILLNVGTTDQSFIQNWYLGEWFFDWSVVRWKGF